MTVMLAVLSRAAEVDATRWPDENGRVWILRSGSTVLADQLHDQPADGVVVLARPQDEKGARLALTVAAGAHPSTRFALRVHAASVLALAAVGGQSLDNGYTATDVVRLVDAQLGGIVSGAWLERVNKLDRPSPRIWQHLRSILPGSPGFVVTLGPEATVAGGPVEVPSGATLLVGAADPSVAARAVHGSQPVAVTPAIRTENGYGSAGAEFVALPRVPALPPATSECRVCRERGDAPVCQFCHVESARQEHVA